MMLLVTSALATMPYTGEQQHAMQLFLMDACAVSGNVHACRTQMARAEGPSNKLSLDACAVSDNVHACRTQMARAEGPSNKLSLPTIMGTYSMDETLAYFKFQC
jgi:hypothetical protein